MASVEEVSLIPWIALAISASALIVSAMTAWHTHFRKMRLFTTAGVLFFATHRADPQDYFLEFMTTVSFANHGAQPGRVLAARIRAVLKGDGDSELAIFPLEGELLGEDARDSFGAPGGTSAAKIDPGVPFIILGGSAVVKTLQFAGQWQPRLDVPSARLRLVLEMYTDRTRKWESCQAWTLASTTDNMSHLVQTMFDEEVTLVSEPEDAP